MAATQKADTESRRFSGHIGLRVQPAVSRALAEATAKRFTSPSEYVRRCVIDGLRADGFDPAAFAA